MKFLAASLLVLSVFADKGDKADKMELDTFLSGTCNSCQPKDIDNDPLLCAGFANRLCDIAKPAPSYCGECDGYFVSTASIGFV